MSFLRLSRTLVPTLRLRAPVSVRQCATGLKRLPHRIPIVNAAAAVRCLATSSGSGSGPAKGSAADSAERDRLIAQYPYPWPWGQKFDVSTGKYTIKVSIPQDRPAIKQHKLAYKIDPAPAEVPPAPSFFVGPAGKAAHKLFDEALKANVLDNVKQSLDKFLAVYESKRDIKNALLNPRTTIDDKLKYVRDVTASVGCDELTAEHLLVLQKAKRLGKVAEIARNYATLLAEHRKERHGSVISAEPLSDAHFEQIREKMLKLVRPDERLIISREVNPDLVGGFVIRIGNRAQNLSVAAQITRMETHLKEFFAKNKQAVDKVLAS